MAEEHLEERHGTTARVDARIRHVLEIVERVLIYVVALFLVGFAVLALVDTVAQVSGPIFRDHDYTTGITTGIDTAFLTIILLERLHTVLSRGPISRQLQEFLVIGITSGVRHSLEIAVGGNGASQETRTVCDTVTLALHRTRRVCTTGHVTVPGSTARDVVIARSITTSRRSG